jgi:hypothetical protein
MPVENKRLLVALEQAMKEITRDTINPLFPELSITDIKPIMNVIALARANYVTELFKISEMNNDEQQLTAQMVNKLRSDRLVFVELLEAYKVLDTSIEHGFLDVEH